MSTNPSTAPGGRPGDGPPQPPVTLSYPTSPLPQAYQRTLLGQIDARLLQTRAARGIALVLLGAALLVPTIQFTLKINETKQMLIRPSDERARSALGRWLPTAEAISQPGSAINPYGAGHWFPTPPLMLLSLVPLTKVSLTWAAIIWAGAKVLGFVVGMWLVISGMRLVGNPHRPIAVATHAPSQAGAAGMAVPLGVLLMAAAFSMRPVVSDLQHGNLNIFMAAWLAIAWGLYQRSHDLWAGIFLALAVVTKVTPALAVVYFAYKREWRVVAGVVVGLALFVFVVPGAILGFEKNWLYLNTWFEMMVKPFAFGGYASREITNQSIYGTAMRLLSNAGVLAVEGFPDALINGMDNMVRPATLAGRLLKPAVALPIVLTLAWQCRTRGAARRDPRLLLEFGLVLLAMLLLSERTWKHHATTLPIVFLGVWYTLTCIEWSDRFRAWYVAGLGVQFFLLVAASEGLFPGKLADKMLDGGFFCWGMVLCFAMTAVMLSALRRRAASADAAPAA